jgi:hypothetical protein
MVSIETIVAGTNTLIYKKTSLHGQKTIQEVRIVRNTGVLREKWLALCN